MEKPILFNTEMVKAILDDSKTETRRVIKRTPSNDDPCGYGFWKEYNERDKRWYVKDYTHAPVWWTLEEYISKFSKYHVGDIIWVRETWAVCDALNLCSPNKCNIEHQLKEKIVWYKADGEQPNEGKTAGEHMIGRGRWRPSIHMPREASRLFLKVKAVRIEELHELDYEDVAREGLKTGYDGWTLAFKNLWNGTLKKDQLDMYGWDSNPWVWVIEFEKV